MLTLFGYGQDQREEYLLLKVLQVKVLQSSFFSLLIPCYMSIYEEIKVACSIDDVIQSHLMYMTIAIHYIFPKQVTYVCEALQNVIEKILTRKILTLKLTQWWW